MKAKLALTATLLALACVPALRADKEEKDHKHEHKEAGPNGGRVLHSVEPHCEFFVMADRKLQITFLGEDGKAIAPAGQTVSAVGGERSKPTKFAFAKTGNALISVRWIDTSKGEEEAPNVRCRLVAREIKKA